MKYLLTAALIGISPTCASAGQVVVLIHGLARSADSLSKLADRLDGVGYRTCNIDYPSTKYPIEVLTTDYVLPRIRECVGKDPGPIHFVTHSLGGIIVREIRQVDPELPIGRVVMLGPPNHGSELVDHLRSWTLFQWINGPAGQQLGTGTDSVPNTLGPVDFELGVIAGNKPFLEPFAGYIEGPGDGKVSVESAKLEGMEDYVVLPVTHMLMMRNDAVIEQTIEFLQNGRFSEPVVSSP